MEKHILILSKNEKWTFIFDLCAVQRICVRACVIVLCLRGIWFGFGEKVHTSNEFPCICSVQFNAKRDINSNNSNGRKDDEFRKKEQRARNKAEERETKFAKERFARVNNVKHPPNQRQRNATKTLKCNKFLKTIIVTHCVWSLCESYCVGVLCSCVCFFFVCNCYRLPQPRYWCIVYVIFFPFVFSCVVGLFVWQRSARILSIVAANECYVCTPLRIYTRIYASNGLSSSAWALGNLISLNKTRKNPSISWCFFFALLCFSSTIVTILT